MLVNMTEAEWDAVIKVHLKGTFAPVAPRRRVLARSRQAGPSRSTRASSTPRRCRASTATPARPTTAPPRPASRRSRSSPRASCGRYGITVNAIAPGALTRLTEDLGMGRGSDEEKARMHPRWIAPIVTWLASTQSSHVTGRVFEASGRGSRHRRGLAPRPDRHPGRRSDQDRTGRRRADAHGAQERGHGRPRPGLNRGGALFRTRLYPVYQEGTGGVLAIRAWTLPPSAIDRQRGRRSARSRRGKRDRRRCGQAPRHPRARAARRAGRSRPGHRRCTSRRRSESPSPACPRRRSRPGCSSRRPPILRSYS